MGDLEPRPDPELRIGDADRERVAEILRKAAGDGRISLEELDQRLEKAYAARTASELAPVTADLSVSDAPRRRPAEVVVPHQKVVAVLGSADRHGEWTVPAELTVTAVMGGASLDFRQATFTADVTDLHVTAVMGGCEILVNPQTRVLIEGSGVMGSFAMAPTRAADESTPDSPVLRVSGVAFWGGVTVYRKVLRSERPK